MNILFVCKHNMFRSKIAEVYFKKINKNREININSAGVIQGYLPLDKREVKVAKKFGINLEGKPKGLSVDLLKKQNLIIIVADDVPKFLFNNREYIDFSKTKIVSWEIKDRKLKSEKEIGKIIKQIINKIKKLSEDLGNK